MQLFTARPAGDAMAVTIWGASSSWTLTALPLFILMGEILFRTRLSEDMFRGLAPLLGRIPGRLLHTNVLGCTIFAAVSGSSAATCATIGKMTLPELQRNWQLGGCGNAGAFNSAFYHHDCVWRDRRGIDRQALYRWRNSGNYFGGAVFGLYRGLVVIQS
jgi:hypothetical protein